MNELELIKSIIMQCLKEMKSDKILATVISYSAPNAVVRVLGNDATISVPNYTNQTLAPNDIVILVSISGNNDLTNSFIGWKKA